MNSQNCRMPSKVELDEDLDAALKNTFPASDPVTVGEITSEQPDRPANRMPALLDKKLVGELATRVMEKQKDLKR